MSAQYYNRGYEWDEPRSDRQVADDRTQRNSDRYYQDNRPGDISLDQHVSTSTWAPGYGTRVPARGVRDVYDSGELPPIHSPIGASQGANDRRQKLTSHVRNMDDVHGKFWEHSSELKQDRRLPRNLQPSRPFQEITASYVGRDGDNEYLRSRGLYPKRSVVGYDSQEDARGPPRWTAQQAHADEAHMYSIGIRDVMESGPRRGRTSPVPGWCLPSRFKDKRDEGTRFAVNDFEAYRSKYRYHLDYGSHSYPNAFRGPDTTDSMEPSQGPYTVERYTEDCWGNTDERGPCRGVPSPQSEWRETLDMMPSQVDRLQGTLRFRGSLRGRRNPQDDMREAGHTADYREEHMTESEIVEALACIREQAWPMDRRRLTRKHLRMKLEDTEAKWYSVGPVASVMKKSSHKVTGILQVFDPWHQVLKRIEGKFGTSVVAVFNFIRDMIQLNLVLALLLVSGVVVPSVLSATDVDQGFGWQALEGSFSRPKDLCSGLNLSESAAQGCNRNYVEHLKTVVCNHTGKVTDLVQDFLQGTGFLEWSLLFSGFYPVTTASGDYLVSLAYILTVLVVYLISLLYIAYFVAKFLRQTSGTVSKYGMIFSNIIFAGWNFTVSESGAARTEHRLIMSELKAAFDDEEFLKRKLERTRNDLAQLYLARILVNIIVLFLITGGWIGIYFLVKEAEKQVNDPFQQFLWDYAPTMTVALLNFTYPAIFNFVVTFEHYRGRTELLLTLGRCVLVRLTSLGILVITKLNLISNQIRGCDPKGKDYICWETHLGQQVYSVLVLDVLIQLGMTFVINVARKGLGHLENSLCKRVSQIEFDVPGHVLDIVYIQAICWLGVMYAPLMATVCFFTFCTLFGLKLFTVSWTCVPGNRVFRASRSSAMFTTILLLAFVMCLMSNGWAMLSLSPSKACSPFRGLGSSWESLTYYICRMDNSASWIRFVLFTMDDVAVTITLTGLVILLFTFYFSVIKARNALIKRLEKKLKDTAKDKAYLMEEYKRIGRADT